MRVRLLTATIILVTGSHPASAQELITAKAKNGSKLMLSQVVHKPDSTLSTARLTIGGLSGPVTFAGPTYRARLSVKGCTVSIETYGDMDDGWKVKAVRTGRRVACPSVVNGIYLNQTIR